jgi:predicted permease|tara:strand:+ start:391 stop:1329 length:939 start_codon:yes stop_codon:yes gene_type:complete
MFGPVLDVIFPIFGLLMVGYITVMLGWFDRSAIRGLTRFVFDFAVPMLLLRTVSTAQLPEDIPWNFLASYYLATMLVLFSGLVLTRIIYRITFSEQVVSAFSCSFSNTVLLGIPLVLLAFGDQGALPLFIIIGTHGFVMFPLFTIMMEIGQIGKAPVKTLLVKTSYGLITNPLVIGLLGGLGCNLLGITLWKPLDEIAKLLGNAVTPGALFALGATLAGFRKKIQWKELPMVVLMKIIVHPLLVWLLAVIVFSLTETIWIQVLVILAALPTGVNPFLFASRYNAGQLLSSGTVFISTFISIFTLSALLSFFK